MVDYRVELAVVLKNVLNRVVEPEVAAVDAARALVAVKLSAVLSAVEREPEQDSLRTRFRRACPSMPALEAASVSMAKSRELLSNSMVPVSWTEATWAPASVYWKEPVAWTLRLLAEERS